jgi:MoaA/NifB/PqqE/SkfB family radical SAM enzyme
MNRIFNRTRTTATDVAQRTRTPIVKGPDESRRASLGTLAYAGITEGFARLLRSPQYIILFVSDKCWMRCAHCWFNEEWKTRELNQPSLTFEEYELLAQSIPRVAFLSLTGGEAFQRPDIVELATMFRKTSKVSRYQIPTSGFRTDLIINTTQQLLKANPSTPFRVDVSLDGVGEVHEAQRGVRNGFERAVETIKALNILRRRYKHLDVGVITTISKFNQHNVRETSELIEEIHPEGEWIVNIARGHGRDPCAVEIDPDTYRLAQELIRTRIARGAYHGHGGHHGAKWLSAKNAARRDIIAEMIDGGYARGGCAAGSLAGVIQSDGTVKVCEMLDDQLGNVREFDYDLVRLWQANAARAMRRHIQTSRCQCTQECFLSMSMLISPDAWRRMLVHRWELDRFGFGR